MNNIEDGINQVKKMHLQSGFKITHIYADSEFWNTISGSGWPWNDPQLHVQEGTCSRDWMVQPYHQVTCSIFSSGHALHADFKINHIPYHCYCHFVMIDFTLSKPVMGLSNTKDPGQLILGTTVEYKSFPPSARQICSGTRSYWQTIWGITFHTNRTTARLCNT